MTFPPDEAEPPPDPAAAAEFDCPTESSFPSPGRRIIRLPDPKAEEPGAASSPEITPAPARERPTPRLWRPAFPSADD